MLTAIYLLLGLAAVGGGYYALTQIASRQRRLHAELTRLEQLTAEVAMTAEATLDQIDERIERLNRLAAQVEAKVEGRGKTPALPQPDGAGAPDATGVPGATGAPQAVPPATPATPAGAAVPPAVAAAAYAAAAQTAPAAQPAATGAPAPAGGAPVKRKRGRPRKHPLPEQPAAASPAPSAQAPAAPPAAAPVSPTPPSPKVQAVTALATEGKSVAEIAEALAIPRGEVQLILNLRKVTA